MVLDQTPVPSPARNAAPSAVVSSTSVSAVGAIEAIVVSSRLGSTSVGPLLTSTNEPVPCAHLLLI